MAKMKRSVLRKAKRTFDIKKDLSLEQLAGIGAVAMAYTEAEYCIDALIFEGMALSRDLGLEITTRINGMDGKIEIVRIMAATFLRLPPDVLTFLDNSLGNLKHMKTHRDLIIHAHIIDASAGIGLKIDRRASLKNVLLTTTYLDAIYSRLILFKQELGTMITIFQAMGVRVRIDPLYLGDLNTGLVGQNLQERFSQVQEIQKKRLSLPPLPELPDLHEVPLSAEPP